jgi:hypothetical protein
MAMWSASKCQKRNRKERCADNYWFKNELQHKLFELATLNGTVLFFKLRLFSIMQLCDISLEEHAQ